MANEQAAKAKKMAEIDGIVMKKYNGESAGFSRFMISWENSVTKKTREAVVRFSRSAVERALQEPGNTVELEKCKGGSDMGVYLVEITSYDEARNLARMRLIGSKPEFQKKVLVGCPLCSKKFFERFWSKNLSKYGDMVAALTF